MSRQKPNCLITRNFAFGDKQYKKGKTFYLDGEVKEFAALKRCAIFIKADKPEVKEVISSQAEGSDIAP